jgi:hypothetical protein
MLKRWKTLAKSKAKVKRKSASDNNFPSLITLPFLRGIYTPPLILQKSFLSVCSDSASNITDVPLLWPTAIYGA